jgi:triosephosphate isomerase
VTVARTPLIAGNWKMHKTVGEATALAAEVREKCAALAGAEVAVAPPFTALAAVARVLQGSSVRLAAQNCHWERAGAFTGEVSPAMLADLGCAYCIVGHSERRQLFGDTDEAVNRRVRALLDAGIRPILCVGETLAEREEGTTFRVVQDQLRRGLAGVGAADVRTLVVAYEPVWAIGTGRNATPEQAQEVHGFLRRCLAEWYDAGTAEATRIQYGGSVKPGNIAELMAQPDIDGALVGGASLEAGSFIKIAAFGR